MRAIEYYERDKHIPFPPSCLAKPEDVQKWAVGLFNDFLDEYQALVKTRHISLYRGECSIISELNQKWNSLSGIFEKNHGASPINKDAFLRACNMIKKW